MNQPIRNTASRPRRRARLDGTASRAGGQRGKTQEQDETHHEGSVTGQNDGTSDADSPAPSGKGAAAG